jgi:hypothetical protein
MKIYFNLAIILMVILTCSPTQKFVLSEPEPGKSLLVGAILVENDGVEEVYEAITKNVIGVVMGKFEKGGKEVTESYRVKTDENGYFAIPNVNPGSYVLKGIEVDLGYSTRLLLTSRWEGNTQIYYPTEVLIDNTVRIWPPVSNDRIIDFNIHYFRIDAVQRVFDETFPELINYRLNLAEQTYTMPNPVQYYKNKYPDWGWFK